MKLILRLLIIIIGKIENYSDYLNNENIKNIVDSIVNLDMNNISFKNAFEFLCDLQIKLKGT